MKLKVYYNIFKIEIRNIARFIGTFIRTPTFPERQFDSFY